MNTDSCVMILQPDDEAVMDGPVGSYYIKSTPTGRIMFIKLPDGSASIINLRPTQSAGPSWEYDGNLESPTLSPSLHHIGGWHGFARAGRLESC
jgi:hypothetical protein